MKKCAVCGNIYDEREYDACPSCGNSNEGDVVSLELPEYTEEVPHIIGTVENEQQSFRENRAEIYQRNNLMVREYTLAEQEKNYVQREEERQVIEKLEKEDALQDSWKKFNRIALIGGLSALAAIAIAVGVIVLARNLKSNVSSDIAYQAGEGRRAPVTAELTTVLTTAFTEGVPAAAEELPLPEEETQVQTEEAVIEEPIPVFERAEHKWKNITTDKCSYDIDAYPVEGGKYVRVDLCFQALSDEVKYFYPRAFSIVADRPQKVPGIYTLPTYYSYFSNGLNVCQQTSKRTFEFDGQDIFIEHGGSNTDKIELDSSGYLEISMIFPTYEEAFMQVSDYKRVDGLCYNVSEEERRYDYTDYFLYDITL